MRRTRTILKGLFVVLLLVGATGCDTLEGINPFNSENEVTGVVEAVDTQNSTLTVDGIVYTVNSDTKFEGINGLSDLSTGDKVEIEYEKKNGGREAKEIEKGGSEDGSGDDD